MKCVGFKPEVVVIPKSGTEYVFKAGIVTQDDWREFETTCPKPTPATTITTKEGTKPNVNDPAYQQAIADWTIAKTNFLIVRSLMATDGLEWDTVNLSDPYTYDNFKNDLFKAGFSDNEIAYLINAVMTMQGLNTQKIEEATKSFLARQEANL